MVFETKRLILRPWEESDAESLFEYAKDPAVGPIAGWPAHTSVENSREIIKTVLSASETYAVCLKDDNRAIGSIGLFSSAQSGKDEMEIGYWIGVPFWGNGYIPEAVRTLQTHAFTDPGCTALWCAYYDGNVKSKRCQEKCGFRYHHTEENSACPLMGETRTARFTKLTREAWCLAGRASKRQAILLNGPSSAGKSTIARALQDRLTQDCEIIALDDYLPMTEDESIWENDVYAVMPKMREALGLTRHNVIIDHVITSQRIFDSLIAALDGFRVTKVLVTCASSELRRRERSRGNRCAGSAEASLQYLYPTDGYDLIVDSGLLSPQEAAETIAGYSENR
ncbi:MAG: GNAT family N-acetyltransferase [Faecousia sp.]